MKRWIFALVVCLASAAWAEHPQVMVTPAYRDAVVAKIQQCPWAKEAYAALKARVDPYVERCQSDPTWMSSRLAMNWQTHYQTPICRNSKWVGGEGEAPVPTPRFAGARDWATNFSAPPEIADWKPYNDQGGKVWLLDKQTGQMEWVDPGLTGRTLESMNMRIMESGADAAFVYWISGDEKYAKYAADILWTYMDGFSYVTPPNLPSGDRSMTPIIGVTSFEVIHEDIATPLSESYDFLHDYLRKEGKDVTIIQKGLKRFADRLIEGGSGQGNWNLNAARIIAYAGLALESNESYDDGKGRPYYVDVVLNAQLPNKTGITHVIDQGYDPQTMLWPEAPGYGFGGTKDIVLIASLVGADPAGRKLLADPRLTRAILAQLALIYPNGWSVGVGDTTNTRINATALELLIAAAHQRDDSETEARLTPALRREIDMGGYDRGAQSSLLALTKYIGQLEPGGGSAEQQPRTYFATPLNIIMQRNAAADPRYALAAALYGTAGGHVHANGMAIELYGGGVILGADPGRGVSYWQPDHANYYSQPPAHNTVIVDGSSTYPIGAAQIALQPEALEPAFGENAVSPDFGFVEASFQYKKPAADQQRTLALVRTGPRSGFYFDVFRSRAQDQQGEFHDYLYHDIGRLQGVADAAGKPLAWTGSSDTFPSQPGLLKGYGYFQQVKWRDEAGDIQATFDSEVAGADGPKMALWMPGAADRRVFCALGPPDHAGRESLPKGTDAKPMAVLIVRQNGEAWRRPFVAVYEPYLGSDGPVIQSVTAAGTAANDGGLAACTVRTVDGRSILLAQDDQPTAAHVVDGCTMQGDLCAVERSESGIQEIYLGCGRSAGDGRVNISSQGDVPISAWLTRDGEGWRYSAGGPVRLRLVFAAAGGEKGGSASIVCGTSRFVFTIDSQQSGGGKICGVCDLPAASDAQLTLGQ
jgi:hypothetical protein